MLSKRLMDWPTSLRPVLWPAVDPAQARRSGGCAGLGQLEPTPGAFTRGRPLSGDLAI